MKLPRLTAELTQKIASSIRSGGYGHVAAQAWGVPRKVYERWLRKGRGKRAPEPYATFAVEVDSALAQARLRAEINAFKKDARVWLEHGPGKEKSGNPGWTGPVKPGTRPDRTACNLFEQVDFMDMCRRVLDALLPFPEARTGVADALLAMADAEKRRQARHSKHLRVQSRTKEDKSSWSASENGMEPVLRLLRGATDAPGDGTEARTTTTSPPAAPDADGG